MEKKQQTEDLERKRERERDGRLGAGGDSGGAVRVVVAGIVVSVTGERQSCRVW